MKHELSPALRREYFRQQSPVVIVKAQKGSKPAHQQELEAIAEEMAAEYAGEDGDKPFAEVTALITDAWGSKIGAIGLHTDMISWAWVTPASREDRDYLMLAFDVLQAACPAIKVWPGQTEMEERFQVFFQSAPHRHPGRDAYNRKASNAQANFATLSVNGQMG